MLFEVKVGVKMDNTFLSSTLTSFYNFLFYFYYVNFMVTYL